MNNIFFDPEKEFLSESKKQMKEIRAQLKSFTEKVIEGKKIMFEDNSDFFRAIHSISGGSSFAGFKEIEEVSWGLEKIITNLFSGKLEPSKEIADLIEKVISSLEYAFSHKGKIKKNEGAALLKKIEAILLENDPPPSPLKKRAPDPKVATEKKEVEAAEHFRVTVSENTEKEKEEQEETVSENQFVSFRIGTENYAVPISMVYDMKEMLPFSRIPKQPEHYLGVANLRGNIVPIIDFRSFLGIKNPQFNQYTVFLMLKINEKVKGCVVDGINDVVVLDPENTHTTPSVSRKTNLEYIDFIAKDPKSGEFLIVLDVERMLEDE